jgi:hypothetical protein
MRGEERKPTMDKDRRKVLNLLEYLCELSPSMRICQLIFNAIPPAEMTQREDDIFYITDAELAGWLQSYTELVSAYRKAHDV